MRKLLLINIFAGLSALCFVGCAPTSSNTNRTVSNINTAATNSNASSNVSDNLSSSDKEFMDKALQGGMEEVQLGGIAAEKAKNDEVRAFAQKMINEHSEAGNDLREIGKKKGVSLVGGTSAEQQKEMGEMSKLSGAEFDKAYVKKMVEAHEKDVAEFQKQSQSANDTDVRRFAAETLPTLKTHLEMIKDIQEKLK